MFQKPIRQMRRMCLRVVVMDCSQQWGDYANFAQMLLNGGQIGGTRVIGRKTLELMHANHLPSALLPWQLLGQDNHGYGFGLGSRVMMDVAASAGPGSVGEYGWGWCGKNLLLG